MTKCKLTERVISTEFRRELFSQGNLSMANKGQGLLRPQAKPRLPNLHHLEVGHESILPCPRSDVGAVGRRDPEAALSDRLLEYPTRF